MSKDKTFEALGEYLREKREASGFSQTEVASVLKVKPQFISNWERGMSGPPIRHLKVVFRMYGVGGEELVSELLALKEKELCEGLGIRSRK